MRDKHDTSAMGRHRCNHGTRCALCPSVPLRTPSRVLIPRGTRALSLLPVFLFLCLWLSKDFVLPSWFSVLVTRAAYFRFAGAAQQLSCRGLGLRLGAVQDSGAPDKIIIIERCALLRCILRIVVSIQVHYTCVCLAFISAPCRPLWCNLLSYAGRSVQSVAPPCVQTVFLWLSFGGGAHESRCQQY
jgi:hypothetical protein